MSNREPENVSLEETLIGILGYVKQVFRYVAKRWYIPLICLLLGATNAYFKARKEKGLYNFNIKFVKGSDLNPNSSGFGGLPNVFSQRSSGNDISVVDVVYSDIILSEALLSKYEEEKDELLIDLFMRTYFPERSKTIKFTSNNINSFTNDQINLFKAVKGRLQSRTNGILNVIDANVPSIGVSTENEKLSIGLAENIFVSLNDFYSSTSAIITKRNIDRLTEQSDSLKNILRVTEAQLATIKDVSGLDIKPTNYLSQARLEQKAKLLQEQFVGIERLLVQEYLNSDIIEPVYKVLNKPIPPLSARLPNFRRAIIVGGFLGAVVGLFIVLIILGLTKFWAIYKKA